MLPPRTSVVRWVRKAERLPQHAYEYGEFFVGIALVIGATVLITAAWLWILLVARVAEILT